jgi:molecular chaperone HscC
MILGIDLETTNSLVAVRRNGETALIPNALGHVLTPSAVSLDVNGEVIVGLSARERLSTHSARTASVFKRYMRTKRVFTSYGRSRS